MKFRYIIYCGRFQPPHYGHLASVMLALKYCNKVCLGIRDTKLSFKNPLTVKERIELWKMLLENENIIDRVIIKPVQDFPKQIITDDKQLDHPLIKWAKSVEKVFNTSPQYDAFMGNKPHMVLAFNLLGYIVIPAHRNLFRHIDVSASKLRQLIINNDSRWKLMLPKIVVDYLESINIRERLIMYIR